MHASNPSTLALAERCSYCQPMELALPRLVRGDPRARRDRRRRAIPLAMALETLEQRMLMSLTAIGSPITVAPGDGSRIAAAANGDFVVVWQNGSNSPIELEFQMFNSAGQPLTDTTVVDGTTTDPVIQKESNGGLSSGLQTELNPHYFDVAMDASGDFVVVWQGDSHIFAEQFDHTGTPQGSLITVSTGSANTEPTVAMDPAGDFTVGWVDDQAASVYIQTMTPKITYQSFYNYKVTTTTQSTGSHYATASNYITGVVQARRFDSQGNAGSVLTVSGSAVSTPANKASTSFSTDLAPSVAMDTAGDFVVGWDQNSYAPVKTQAAPAYHYSQKGSTYDSNTSKYVNYVLNSYTGAQFDYNLVVAGTKVMYQRFTASDAGDPTPTGGNTVAQSITSSARQFVSQGSVAVSMDSAGDFAISSNIEYVKETLETVGTGQNASTYTYYQSSSAITARRYAHTDAAVGGAITVAKTALTPKAEQSAIPPPLLTGMAMAMNSSGELFLAWNQYAYDTYEGQISDDFDGSFGRRYDPTGKSLDASPIPFGDAGMDPSVSYAGAATVDVAYAQVNNDVFSITVQPYRSTASTHLKLTVTPRTLKAGVDGSLALDIDDAKGKPVAAENGDLTLSVLTGPETQSQFTTTATAGVAEFTNLDLTTAGVYTFEIQYGSLTATTGKITVNPGHAVAMTILEEPPGTVVAGANITPPIKAELFDAFGNVATTDKSKVTLSIATSSASASSLSGILTASVSKGIATFKSVSLHTAGAYTLKAADTTNATVSALTASFAIVPAAAAKLAFLEPPQPVVVNADISPPVAVAIEDKFGNIVLTGTQSTANITISLALHPKLAVLATASPTLAAQNGTAGFADLSVSLAGKYTLTAVDGKLSLTSPSFTAT